MYCEQQIIQKLLQRNMHETHKQWIGNPYLRFVKTIYSVCLEDFTRCRDGLRKNQGNNEFCTLWVYSGYYRVFRVQVVCNKRSHPLQFSVYLESCHVALVHFRDSWRTNLNTDCRYFFTIDELAELFDLLREVTMLAS